MEKILFTLCYGLMWVQFVIYFYVLIRVFKQLKEEHPEVWRELGSPTLIKNNTFENTATFFRFLRHGKYNEIDDPLLTKRCRLLWLLFYTYGITFVCTINTRRYDKRVEVVVYTTRLS